MAPSDIASYPAFNEILRQNRARFNAQFAAVRLNSPSLDGALFGTHLAEAVAPLVQAVYDIRSDRAFATAEALYGLSLDLFARNLLGASPRTAHIPLAWTELFPALTNLLTEEPRRLAGAVCNALLQLESEPGARTEQWMEGMALVAPQCRDAKDFLQAGEIAAWRCGIARHRLAALRTAKELAAENEPLCLTVLGAAQNGASAAKVIAAYEKNPWWTPAEEHGERRLRKVAGAFRGLAADKDKAGAVFMAPPRVTVHEGQFFAADEETVWLMYADAFGASFHRVGELLEFSGDPNSPSFGGPLFGVNEFPEFTNPQSIASDGITWAVTLPYSYGVYLLG